MDALTQVEKQDEAQVYKTEFNAGKHSNVSVIQFSKTWYYYLWPYLFLLIFIFIYLAALGLSGSVWALVSWPEIEPGPPAQGAQSLSHWTTKEVPLALSLSYQITHSTWYKKHHFPLVFISPCVTTISVRSAWNHSNGLFFESFLIFY